ncbi:MAG: hypothetical protein HKL92_10165 [Candidatus Eremiobacteraeota bacterium]|nr:hypothetical protein [Candidatus Eremiobacteraeota bacterium]
MSAKDVAIKTRRGSIRERAAALAEDARQRQMQLPFPAWPERFRSAPNVMLRSALFGVVRSGRRKYVEEMPLPALGKFSIFYTGKRLDQVDLDIYLQIVHYSREQTVDDWIRFPLHRLLDAIGRGKSGADYKWLHSRVIGMSATAMTIRDGEGKMLITGGLIRDFGYDEQTGEVKCRLNEYLRGLFDGDTYTRLDWDSRLALKNNQLAKWLHGYYATHAAAHPLKVATVKALCGSEIADLKKFRQSLRAALEELKVRGLLRSWRIDARDLLHVVPLAAPSQARRLESSAR